MRYWVWRSIDNVAIGALPRALVTAVTTRGGVPEWLKGADCKSAGVRLRWFESSPLHQPPQGRLVSAGVVCWGDGAVCTAAQPCK